MILNMESGGYTPPLNMALFTLIVSTHIFYSLSFIISLIKVELIMMLAVVMIMVYYLEASL